MVSLAPLTKEEEMRNGGQTCWSGTTERDKKDWSDTRQQQISYEFKASSNCGNPHMSSVTPLMWITLTW
jgi:hypothetical protein